MRGAKPSANGFYFRCEHASLAVYDNIGEFESMTCTVRLTDRFGNRVVLRGVDLALAEHRVGVVGANGSGKSTLARLLNGLVVPTEGSVVVDGLDTARDRAAVRR